MVLSVVDDLGVRVVMDELLSATSQSDGKFFVLIKISYKQKLSKFQAKCNCDIRF